MAGALIGALRVTLGLDATYFEDGTKGATRAARKLQKDLKETGEALTSVGQKMTIGITAPLTALGVASVKAAMESKDALAQVENTLKTMGDAAGYSADQLSGLASDMMHNSLYDDDEILRQLTNTMLTFGKVSGTEFKRAQQASLDLSAKFGKDLQGSAIMVGKALNDPVKGITALTKVGISFTAQQKEQVKAMVEAGKTADAQRLILSELERQVSGSAKAAADANPMTALKHAWDDFQEQVGAQLLELLPAITDALTTAVQAFGSLSPEMQKWAVLGGIAAAALGPILMALGSIIGIIATLAPQMVALGEAISAAATAAGVGGSVIGTLGTALGMLLRFLGPIGIALTVVYAIWKNWDTIGPMLSDLWASIQSSIGPGFMALVESVKNALIALWQGPFGSLIRGAISIAIEFGKVYAFVMGPVLLGVLRGLGAVVGEVFGQIARVLNMIVALVSGDFSGAWRIAKDIVSNAISGTLRVIEAMVPGAINAMKRLYEGVKEWLGNKVDQVFGGVRRGIEAVTGAFYTMYDKVVGHSYVPDMVDEIAATMARLDSVMVDKAKKTTKTTAEAFREMQQDVRAMFAEMFPDAQQLTEYNALLARIKRAEAAGPKKGGITADEAYRLRMQAARERGEEVASADDASLKDAMARFGDLNEGPIGIMDTEQVQVQLRKFAGEVSKTDQDIKNKTASMIVSFAEMARDVTGTMRSMVQSFKSGDILGGLMGVLDMVSQVASIISGVKGKTITTRSATPSTTGFSTGGSFKVGGSGGVDSKLVQFRATPGEMVDVRRPGALKSSNDNIIVRVVKGEMFDAHVERVATPLAQDAAQRGAMGGAAKARLDQARMQRNALK